MKKLLILIAAIGFTTAYAQRGYNGYHANANRGGNTGYNEAYRGGSNYNRPRGGQRGHNAYRGYDRGYNRGSGYQARGGVVHRGYDSRRVVYRNHNRSGYRWRVVEERYYVPGYYTYVNGCRRYVDPCYRWRTVSRTCVPAPRAHCW